MREGAVTVYIVKARVLDESGKAEIMEALKRLRGLDGYQGSKILGSPPEVFIVSFWRGVVDQSLLRGRVIDSLVLEGVGVEVLEEEVHVLPENLSARWASEKPRFLESARH